MMHRRAAASPPGRRVILAAIGIGAGMLAAFADLRRRRRTAARAFDLHHRGRVQRIDRERQACATARRATTTVARIRLQGARAGRSIPDHGLAALEGTTMTYAIKPLSCDPKKLKGLSEKLIVSHWENNYSGAVKRLNAISGQLAA